MKKNRVPRREVPQKMENIYVKKKAARYEGLIWEHIIHEATGLI